MDEISIAERNLTHALMKAIAAGRIHGAKVKEFGKLQELQRQGIADAAKAHFEAEQKVRKAFDALRKAIAEDEPA